VENRRSQSMGCQRLERATSFKTIITAPICYPLDPSRICSILRTKQQHKRKNLSTDKHLMVACFRVPPPTVSNNTVCALKAGRILALKTKDSIPTFKRHLLEDRKNVTTMQLACEELI
jgi:hypothetical protein